MTEESRTPCRLSLVVLRVGDGLVSRSEGSTPNKSNGGEASVDNTAPLWTGGFTVLLALHHHFRPDIHPHMNFLICLNHHRPFLSSLRTHLMLPWGLSVRLIIEIRNQICLQTFAYTIATSATSCDLT